MVSISPSLSLMENAFPEDLSISFLSYTISITTINNRGRIRIDVSHLKGKKLYSIPHAPYLVIPSQNYTKVAVTSTLWEVLYQLEAI